MQEVTSVAEEGGLGGCDGVCVCVCKHKGGGDSKLCEDQ